VSYVKNIRDYQDMLEKNQERKFAVTRHCEPCS
jgi:hypothetical protein